MTSPKREALIIADASPLIFLSKLQRLNLLRELAEKLIVPLPVWEEVTAGETRRPEVEAIRRHIEDCVAVPDTALAAAYAVQVDAGEAGALAIAARSENALLLMDDARGRAQASIRSGSILIGGERKWRSAATR